MIRVALVKPDGVVVNVLTVENMDNLAGRLDGGWTFHALPDEVVTLAWTLQADGTFKPPATGALAPPTEADTQAAADAVAQMVVDQAITAGTLTFTQAVKVAAVFPTWEPGMTVKPGDLRYFDGTLVECLQAHTTQADWTPPDVPALWKVWRDPDAVLPWVQPDSTDPYAKGARVTHNGQTWTSDLDGNVWEPSVYGWTVDPA